MITDMKYNGHPVYMFKISGRYYYVCRSECSFMAFCPAGDFVAVGAPEGMSYQRAARIAAHMFKD